jgi:hypothetical protein
MDMAALRKSSCALRVGQAGEFNSAGSTGAAGRARGRDNPGRERGRVEAENDRTLPQRFSEHSSPLPIAASCEFH